MCVDSAGTSLEKLQVPLLLPWMADETGRLQQHGGLLSFCSASLPTALNPSQSLAPGPHQHPHPSADQVFPAPHSKHCTAPLKSSPESSPSWIVITAPSMPLPTAFSNLSFPLQPEASHCSLKPFYCSPSPHAPSSSDSSQAAIWVSSPASAVLRP